MDRKHNNTYGEKFFQNKSCDLMDFIQKTLLYDHYTDYFPYNA